jgi:hypothetical protein
MISLKGKHTTREDAGQENHQQRVHTHELHLLENGVEPEGWPQTPHQGGEKKEHDKSKLLYEADQATAHGLDEPYDDPEFHHVIRAGLPSASHRLACSFSILACCFATLIMSLS